MPMCIPSYEKVEKYIASKDILVRKTICQIYMVGEGERIPSGFPSLISYNVSKRTETALKTAIVKRGSVSLGWFSTSPASGIFIEEFALPDPFYWKINKCTVDDLVDCDVEAKIKEEFGIEIGQYL